MSWLGLEWRSSNIMNALKWKPEGKRSLDRPKKIYDMI